MGMEEMMAGMDPAALMGGGGGGGMPPMGGGMPPGMGGGMPPMEGDPSMMMDPAEEAGRGGDSVLAHLTPGEVIIPGEVAMEISDILIEFLGEEGLASHTVGDPSNSINPETGYPEFSWVSSWTRKAVGWATGARAMENRMREEAARQALEQKRKNEQFRIFQEKESKKARLVQAASSRLGRRKEQILTNRKQAFAKATQRADDTAGNISEVISDRGGMGDIKTSDSTRISSTRSGYRSTPKASGLSLALRTGSGGSSGRPL